MNHSTATAAQKPLPRPLPDFTATRRPSVSAVSTSTCLAHGSTPSTSRAKATGESGGGQAIHSSSRGPASFDKLRMKEGSRPT